MCIYSFFLLVLSFPVNIFVSFIFIALFPNWHLTLVLFPSLFFSQFCSGRYNFWFPLFARSVYCTLFLLDCFDFAYGCICVYSVTLSTVTNLCLFIGLLQFYGFFFPFFHFFSFLYFIILMFLNQLYFLYICSLRLYFLLFFPPCSYSLMYVNLLQLPLFNFAYLSILTFLSFLSCQHIC